MFRTIYFPFFTCVQRTLQRGLQRHIWVWNKLFWPPLETLLYLLQPQHLRTMIKHITFTGFIKRREFININRDCEVIVPYVVVREIMLVIMIDAKAVTSVDCADDYSFHTVRGCNSGGFVSVPIVIWLVCYVVHCFFLLDGLVDFFLRLVFLGRLQAVRARPIPSPPRVCSIRNLSRPDNYSHIPAVFLSLGNGHRIRMSP